MRMALHPAFLAATCGLVINDHYLKSHYPSWFTGKASDALGSFVLTVVLAIGLGLVRERKVSRPTVACLALGVVAAVAGVKTSRTGSEIGGEILGLARWMIEAVIALARFAEPPAFHSVNVAVDSHDIFAALAAFGAVLLTQPSPMSPAGTVIDANCRRQGSH